VTGLLIGLLALAMVLALSPPGSPRVRIRAALAAGRDAAPSGSPRGPAGAPGWRRRDAPPVSMTLLVQQMAALLKGGRTPARLWDELWLLHGGDPSGPAAGVAPGRADSTPGQVGTLRGVASAGFGPVLPPGSVRRLAAARAAAMRGSPVAVAIRSAGGTTPGAAAGWPVQGRGAGEDPRQRRVWFQLAACFDVAEASGCPLADVLTRFAAQLEAEDDAEAARQTALAGPRATVRLLTWLPFLGLGMGLLLGVDPVNVLLGTPLGAAALAAGLALTAGGRIWSARLVRSAAGLQP
jgi:tight adherence protein B